MKPFKIAADLASRYAESPAIRALVQLVPFGLGGAADIFIVARIQSINEERAKSFFDRLALGEDELTDELVQSEDFLHAYFSTVSAALRARRREKTAMFADLLMGSIKLDLLRENDEYEELLSVLETMSYRETAALLIIDAAEASNIRANTDNDLTWAERHLDQARAAIQRDLEVPKAEVTNFIQRISRTGLVEEIGAVHENPDDESGYVQIPTGWEAFRTTARFKRLKFVIQAGQDSTT